MRIKATIFSLAILFLAMAIKAQQVQIIDASTKLPLAFVNIKVDKQMRGTSSDIDGYFDLGKLKAEKYLSLSYVGYADTLVDIGQLKAASFIIALHQKQFVLKPVNILPSENPALAILRKVIDNSKKNDPEQLDYFTYKAYHKFIITADMDEILTALNNPNNKDSSLVSMRNFFQSQHLLISESVSQRAYKAPNKNKETIIASRVSGFKSPIFALLSTQLQSFSFYNANIDLLGKHYINPLQQSSLDKYFFLLEDSLYSEMDTTYIISFRPYKGTHFDGLKGVMHISSHKFALKQIIAQPFAKEPAIGIKVQQNYELIDGFWFPTQLNSDLIFYNILMENTELKGIGRSYLRNIEINPPQQKQRFNNVVLEINEQAISNTESDVWDEFRYAPLDSSELKTYHVLDSLGQAEHLDRKIAFLTTFMSGAIPVSIFDVRIDKLIAFNEFEGFRWGLGLQTNDKLLRWANIEGYGAWGSRDKEWKYGGFLNFKLWPDRGLTFKMGYVNDVFESAKQFYFGTPSFLSTDLYRNLLVEKMVYYKGLSSQLKFRALPHSLWTIGFDYQQINSPDNYQFVVENSPNLYQAKGDFNVAEVQLGLQFAFKEQLLKSNRTLISMGTNYPVLHVNFTQALPSLMETELTYRKLDVQLDYSHYFNFVGKTSLRVTAGMAQGDLPWYKLYNGKGSYVSFYLNTPNSFGTMRINEFLSDEYVAVYWQHDFGKLIFGDRPYIPQPSIVTNYTIGSLQDASKHINSNFNTLEKGYGESGLLLNSILKSSISELGFGLFYRWGAYTFPSVKDNLAYKLTLNYSI